MIKKSIAIIFLSILYMGVKATEVISSPFLFSKTKSILSFPTVIDGNDMGSITVYSSNGIKACVNGTKASIRDKCWNKFWVSYDLKDSTVTIWNYAKRYDPRLEWNIKNLASQLHDIQPVSQGVNPNALIATYSSTTISSSYGSSSSSVKTVVSPPHTESWPGWYITYKQEDIRRIEIGYSNRNHFFVPLKYSKLDYGENYFMVKNPTRDMDREYTKGPDDAEGLTDKSTVYIWKDGVPLNGIVKVLGIVYVVVLGGTVLAAVSGL